MTPTPIQAQTVPIALERQDVIGIAQTGTGKTAAFALPILHHLFTTRRPSEKKCCRVLVLSPTRELSSQILDSFRAYGRHIGITSALAIGGVSMGGQVRSLLNGVDVLVATPGRLLDLVQSNALRLNRVEFFVLDEADRMLDMGFIHDIRKIVAKLPTQRQTLLFSATMPQAIAELAGQMLHNPAKVAVTPVASTVERVAQRIIHVDRPAKSAVLADLLRKEPIDRALVFSRTKHGADKLVRGLAKAGIGAEAIHGNKSQGQRERVLAAFRKGQIRILVATDIAARGIDVDGISHVVNYDLPNVPEDYVHRIGRTARAGASGIAISLCDADEVAFVRAIERLIRIAIPATDLRLNPTPFPPSSTNAGGPDGRNRHRRNGRNGSASNGDRTRADEPRGGHPNGRHLRANGQQSKGPQSNGHQSNHSQSNHSQASRPQANRTPSNHSHSNQANSKGSTSNGADTRQPSGDLSRVNFLHRNAEPRRRKPEHRIADRPE